MLLVDGSTFTVGPGSSLVIDKFVYNPASGKGALVASFSKGALRFVGGKLSKNDPGVKVKTPAGELTVRGGIFTAKISGANKALDHLRLRHVAIDLPPRPAVDHQIRRRRHLDQRRGPGGDPLPDHGRRQCHARRGGRQELEEDRVSHRQEGRLAVLLRHSADRPLPRSALHPGTGYYDGATTGILLNGLTRVPMPTPNIPPIIGIDACANCR